MDLLMTLRTKCQRTVHERKIDKLDFIKIKHFCSAKDTAKKVKKQAIDLCKYLQKTYLIKNCYPKHTKNS